jgi:hypothetical protein
VPDERHRVGRFGEDGRIDPDSLGPEDEENAFGPGGPTRDVVLRAFSVVPFLLVAALGLIGAISWVLVIVLGIGSSEPIWRAARGVSLGEFLWQALLAVLIGLAPILIALGGSWATAHGFGETSGRPFWTAVEGVWGLVAMGLVYVDRARQEWLDDLGLSRLDWWFAFGVVAFAMILAGMRLRRAPRADEDGST